ncbi:hypothetical protein GCM10010495_25560 [Kitasatospora herbaricolor]|uniref:hypothetical protein n=1 Tax=Kitasatospora herbaricolor TaxID=68217 RepID=UPI0019BA7651|nr:hypothetical protein [Kitasatospora herbaricolor]MDQ0311241.1 hypothetical protein [Kitasatospora herbaricolor]GGV11147.1 hypothetical protein GCM10010495_25560 [Kitasatospora herbaricolor]
MTPQDDQQPSPSLFAGAAGHPENPICSGKGCRTAAAWVLVWNNPKLHTPDRRKTWLACDEHREHLSQFLGVRGFLKEVLPFAEWTEAEAEARPQPQPPVAPPGA